MENRREREMRRYKITTGIIVACTVIFVIVFLVLTNSYRIRHLFKKVEETETAVEETTESPEEIEDERVTEVIAAARRIADGYDYDAAIEYIKSDVNYRKTLRLLEEAESLENEKTTMVKWSDVRTISHIYVNTLIADVTKAETGSYKAMAKTSAYLTVDEFKAFLQELYDNNYVLVTMHDVAYWDDDKDKMVWGSIYLPEGKTPIVLSQENMCYSDVKTDNGCAEQLVIDEDGNIKCEMSDGTVGDYDLIPILEQFIYDHPSFSYRGARAVLGITWSNGLFGYNITNNTTTDYQKNYDTVVEIAGKLTELGYEFAFNGYSYNEELCSLDIDSFKNKCQSFRTATEPIIGKTDIVIFPNSTDIGDWRYYSGDYYEYMKSAGYDYFVNCNDSEKCWDQILDNYMRQGRRIICANTLFSCVQGGEYLTDLCDATKVFDSVNRKE